MSAPLTPLLPFYSGNVTVASWFTWAVKSPIRAVRYHLTARTAPVGAAIQVELRNGSTVLATLVLANGSTDSGYVALTSDFTTGDVLGLFITQIGSTTPGANLQLTLDIDRTALTPLPPSQTPYSIIQPGTLSLGSVFSYTMGRTVNLKTLRFQLRSAPSGSGSAVTVSKNGTVVATATIAMNALDSGIIDTAVTFSPGDILSVATTVIGSSTPGSDLVVDLDYDVLDLITDMVGQYYSEPDSDLIKYLRQVGVGSKLADSITTDDLTRYKATVNDLIDSQLMPVYRTPLRTVTRNLKTFFPEPIQFIAMRWVGYLLLNDIYSEVEPNTTGNTERQQKMAMEQLESVANRRVLLRGQRYRARAYGSNPHTELVQPPTGTTMVPGMNQPAPVS